MRQEGPRHDIQIIPGLHPEHRSIAALGYWQAFAQKLRYPLGPQKKAVAFFERVIDPTHAISAVSADGAFLGVAGFKSASGAFVGGTFRDLSAIYGWIGAGLRGCLISMLERDCATGTLLMDGIFVDTQARGRGVGTLLLSAIEQHASATGYRDVRLDVIDTNARARALYERRGFQARSVTSLGPLRYVFGFAHATEMIKPVTA